MKKEDFNRETTEVKFLLDSYYKDNKEIAYVLLLQVEAEEEGRTYRSILTNVKPPIVVSFVHGVMKTIGSLIGRQN